MSVSSQPPELSALQQARLAEFSAEHCVDIHCHVLPAVDDGPASLDDSLAICRALARDGITAAIATPHQLGRFEGRNGAADIRKCVSQLQAILDARKIPLRLAAGGEVRIDHRIAQLLADDRILTLADHGKYLLLELPTSVEIQAESVLSHLQGIEPGIILAHSERYESLWTDPESADEWISRGAALQVNAGGVTGAFGPASQRAAFHWLSRGWVSAVATDAHSVGTRRPMMSEAIGVIKKRFGHDVARCACIENPLRVWNGQPLMRAPIPASAAEDAFPDPSDKSE